MSRRSLRSDAYVTLITGLIEARKDADVTQTELATRLNKHQSWVAKYEGCHQRLDILEFYAVARALKQDPGALLAHIAAGLPKRVGI